MTTVECPAVPGVRHSCVETAGLRWHVAEAGSGQPVLLLHSWPQHWWAWRKVIPLLGPDHHVICPDLRGFGWTDAPRTGYGTQALVDDVLALLDALGLDRVTVVGHDVGGRIGFQLALRAPDRVRRLVTLNAAHPYWTARTMGLAGAARFWWTPLVETPLVGRWLVRFVVRLYFHLGADRGVLSEAEVAEYVARMREPARARASERLMYEFAYREIVPALLGRGRERRLTVPTLMLAGERDPHLSPKSLGGWEPHADELTLRIVPDAGHLLAEQCPDLVADAIRGFAGS
ncbi:MAG TPA: alpha/beta hydrolase [Pseudonocardiaceae bacterium]|nr:alpha/beta hydrolase [Pseudonocardiaceae bacterium]